jgi:ABC-type spermidine/putrescine transport system permease subunit II
MSAVKFGVVCAVYMHLKYDNKLFRNLFVGPLAIAIVTCIGLLFLFGKVAINISSGA